MYATLNVGIKGYCLQDDCSEILISGEIGKGVFIYEEAKVLNLLLKEGWKVVYVIEKNGTYDWYMMFKEDN